MTFSRWFRRQKTNLVREIASPNGKVVAHFILENGEIFYDLARGDKTIIQKSRLGFRVAGASVLGNGLSLVRAREQERDETWQTIVGEEAEIRNHYRETAFYLAENGGKGRLITLRFRLFDEGMAFRYEIPPQPGLTRLTIMDELTEFALDYNAVAYSIPAYRPDRYEYDYTRRYLHELTEPVHTPLTVRTADAGWLCLHEAALYDYGEMTPQFDGERALRAVITPLSDGAKAYLDLPWNSPWRMVMLSDNELGLTRNRMMLNLNEPPRQDFGWVKPLKFMGIWWAMFVGEWTWAPGERHGATTEHAKGYIDACERLGVGGLLVEGWNNGWEGDWLQNGAYSNFTEPQADFNLPEIADYAKKRGVEMIGHHETVGFVDNYEAQLEKAYQYYVENGVHYIKSGYAGSMMSIQGRKEWHHSQAGVRHYQKALELAAKYQICLDVHEPIKSTGIERTWPNLLTREGARGQEYEGGALSPSHACLLPFTRLLAGGFDYTSGIFDVTNQNKRVASTLARQLAYYVTIFSGMQMVADRPRFYEEEQPEAFKFIRDVPVNWRRTLPLLGEIGNFYVVARQDRESADWFIGGVTNEEGRRVRITLDFLEAGVNYRAEIYRDGDDAHYRDNQLSFITETREIKRGDFVDIYMAPGGGFAIRLAQI